MEPTTSNTENKGAHEHVETSSLGTAVPDSGMKQHLGGHGDYHGINTSEIQPGTDAVYEGKIALMNEALIDLGMGKFQWLVFAATGFGWFVDNVCIQLRANQTIQLTMNSSGCKR